MNPKKKTALYIWIAILIIAIFTLGHSIGYKSGYAKKTQEYEGVTKEFSRTMVERLDKLEESLTK